MKPFEMVIVSGKGGTGKTTVASVLSSMTSGSAVLCDTDVDTPDLWILLDPDTRERYDFYGMEMADIEAEACIGCGACREFCRFNAIEMVDGKARVNRTFCEGCGGCELVCPTDAVSMKKFKQGEYYFSLTAEGPFWHARLNPGGENSGLLVQILRDNAVKTARQERKSLVLVDGPPGIACPTISSLTGADLAVVVTEPTMSGRHDLSRLAQLCESMGVPVAVIINKSDISPEHTSEIEEECRKMGWPHLGSIPFRKDIIRAIAGRNIPLEAVKPEIDVIWENLKPLIG